MHVRTPLHGVMRGCVSLFGNSNWQGLARAWALMLKKSDISYSSGPLVDVCFLVLN